MRENPSITYRRLFGNVGKRLDSSCRVEILEVSVRQMIVQEME